MNDKALRRTPLFPIYQVYGARTVAFGGWEMPVQFKGVVEEHRTVRQAAGLFDVSHMGELEVRGANAFAAVQKLVTHDISRLQPGRALYTVMCREHGGIVDDFLVYKLAEDRFMMVVNAANIAKDYEHMKAVTSIEGGAEVVDLSEQFALLALQGPKAATILAKLCDETTGATLARMRPFHFMTNVPLAGVQVFMISRTGYTGEDGFEIMIEASAAEGLWEQLMKVGQSDGLVPVGLGARDTLRLEAALLLYGQDITEETNPIEAGLEPFVKVDKGPFIGRDAIIQVLEECPKRRLVGLEMIDRGIARHGYMITDRQGATIGMVTSGTQSPTLGRSIALGYVETAYAAIGTELAIDIRGHERKARVVKTPFYRAS